MHPAMKPNSVLERHPDLFFQDGEVVLAVKQAPISDEEPRKYTLFRVHRFLLKHHSATFANLFADANAAPTEVYDGVPLAEMHGDKAEDFALLLSYLYNPSSLVFKRNDPNTPLTISGVVRLADKYVIEPLHRCLVQQVCEDWPATLDEYDVKQSEIDTLRTVAASSSTTFKYTPDGGRLADVIPEPASAILFAQEFGCRQILPASFYRLSLIPFEHDWSEPGHTRKPLARWSMLDRENLVRCMRGCQKLSEYRPLVEDFMCDNCVAMWQVDGMTGIPSKLFIERLFEVAWSRGSSPSPTHGDPLRTLAKCADYGKMPELAEEPFSDSLCEYCEQVLSSELVEERKRIWGDLTKWFKLE